jgi:hypothetical protein
VTGVKEPHQVLLGRQSPVRVVVVVELINPQKRITEQQDRVVQDEVKVEQVRLRNRTRTQMLIQDQVVEEAAREHHLMAVMEALV